MKAITHFIAGLAILLSLQPARAQVEGAPATIDFQSQVLDTAGQPLAQETPANYTMQFRIYDELAGGSIIWAETQIVTVANGVFSVRLGSGVPILPAGGGSTAEGETRDLRQAFNGTERYLGLTVAIPGQASTEITPRMAFLSSPFSLVAERAKLADKATEAEVAGSVFQASGSSTLGTTTIQSLTLLEGGVVSGVHALEFGGGSADTAGQIKYGAASGWLDIVGSSKNAGDPRKVRIQADGGLQVNGPLTVVGGKITGDGSGLTGISADLAPESISHAELAKSSVDIDNLMEAVIERLTPAGTIVAYGGISAPAGWLMCDGDSVDRAQYPNLFAAISTRFGNASGDPTKFKLPDFRGRFLRGRDAGAGNDPDVATRTASSPGGATGDQVGSLQGGAVQKHTHNYFDIYFNEVNWWQSNPTLAPDYIRDNVTFTDVPGGFGLNAPQDLGNSGWQIVRETAEGGSAETRPVNVSVNYIIKY